MNTSEAWTGPCSLHSGARAHTSPQGPQAGGSTPAPSVHSPPSPPAIFPLPGVLARASSQREFHGGHLPGHPLKTRGLSGLNENLEVPAGPTTKLWCHRARESMKTGGLVSQKRQLLEAFWKHISRVTPELRRDRAGGLVLGQGADGFCSLEAGLSAVSSGLGALL